MLSQVISTEDDPSLPVFTARTVILGTGLSAFGAVLSTIYTFKPQVLHAVHLRQFPKLMKCDYLQNATVSQLFCLIIAYVLGTAMASEFYLLCWKSYIRPHECIRHNPQIGLVEISQSWSVQH